jgi:hypothetical protein
MRIQTLTGIFPTERPPDPENRSPGTVATETGAEVRSVLRRTPANHPEIIAHAGPTMTIKSAALRIVIEPTASGRKWTARLGDRVLCVTASPLVQSARLLLDKSYSADAVIEVWRPNTRECALRCRLGAVAATVIDGETTSHRAKNGSPARDSERGGNKPAAGLRSSSGRFWGRTMAPANEAARPNPQAPRPTADHALAVYDWQHLIGSIEKRNCEFLALDVHDHRVGVFANQREALRAITAARSS